MKKKNKAKTGGGLVFFFKEGMSNIRVNGFMSFAAISIITICILIVGSFSLTSLNVKKEIAKQVDQSEIMVFIDKEFESEDYSNVEHKMLQIKDVKSVTFISKEQGFEEYKNELGDDAFILDIFENDNPVNDGYIINLETLDYVDTVTEELNKIEEIDTVSASNDTYKALNKIQKGVDVVSIVLFASFGFVSIFIISNTIKLAMFARREQIAIMKMIGATDAFIRWPFIIEGLILGVFSSLLAFGGTWILYNETIVFAQDFIGFLEVVPFDAIKLYVLGAFLAIGSIIGVSGSMLTIRKFLDV